MECEDKVASRRIPFIYLFQRNPFVLDPFESAEFFGNRKQEPFIMLLNPTPEMSDGQFNSLQGAGSFGSAPIEESALCVLPIIFVASYFSQTWQI